MTKKPPTTGCSEDALAPVEVDTEKIRQVGVDFINEPGCDPRSALARTTAIRVTNKGADENLSRPQDEKAE